VRRPSPGGSPGQAGEGSASLAAGQTLGSRQHARSSGRQEADGEPEHVSRMRYRWMGREWFSWPARFLRCFAVTRHRHLCERGSGRVSRQRSRTSFAWHRPRLAHECGTLRNRMRRVPHSCVSCLLPASTMVLKVVLGSKVGTERADEAAPASPPGDCPGVRWISSPGTATARSSTGSGSTSPCAATPPSCSACSATRDDHLPLIEQIAQRFELTG
jgi:hypothetical protein